MDTLFSKLFITLENYYLANYLIGGCAVCFGLKLLNGYNIDENWYTSIIMYYFSGMVASRLSSVVIEPVLKKLKFIENTSYAEFMNAEKADASGKLLELSKVNNIYRTMCGSSLIILLAAIYLKFPYPYKSFENPMIILTSITLFLLFLLSFRKQTSYIVRRVEYLNQDKSQSNEVPD